MVSKRAIIMLCGNPATGKTVSSQKIYETLSEKEKVSLLTTLSIRDSLKLTDLESEESRDKVYEEIVKKADKEFSNGKDILILDGNFNKKKMREGVYSILNKYNADFYAVLCKVNRIEEIEKRMGQRKENPYNIQNKADNIKLYEMIDKEKDPIEEDTINGEAPNIITFNTENNKIRYDINNLDENKKEMIEIIKNSLLTNRDKINTKAIIFDIGGVIQNLRWEVVSNQLVDLKKEIDMDMFRGAFYNQREKYFNLYETNKLKSEEFWKMVALQLGLNEKTHIRISKAFVSLYDPINPNIEKMIRTLKGKYKLIIMSNSCPELRENVESNDFYDIFDKKYFSNEIGMKKPNKDFFEYVLKENNLKAEECVFIDDAPRNIDVANEIGMNGILYLSPHQLEKKLKLILE